MQKQYTTEDIMIISQKQLAFYKMYKSREWIPAWEFIGEIYLPEFNKWEFMSYKTPARLSDLYLDNDLFERRKIKGKSGKEYYSYRIKERPRAEMIKDRRLLDFYRKVKWNTN